MSTSLRYACVDTVQRSQILDEHVDRHPRVCHSTHVDSRTLRHVSLISHYIRHRIVKNTNVEETNTIGFDADLQIRSVFQIETLTDRKCRALDRWFDRQMILHCLIPSKFASDASIDTARKFYMTSFNSSLYFASRENLIRKRQIVGVLVSRKE